MNSKRKICIITGSRAEYGLLHWLIKDIDNSEDFDLQVVVTGMHLSPEFGSTYREIEEDGITIDYKVEMVLSSDTPTGVCKSMGLATSGFADAFHQLAPDVVIVLGDRYEIFSAVSSALIMKIPVAHIHGGELTEGAVDDAMRHSITKMSHLHFTATEKYRKRVIQLGEQPDRVFTVGTLGIDNIARTELLTKDDFEKSIDFKLGNYNLLVTFHPETLEEGTPEHQTQSLLTALSELRNTKIIFTKANSDTHGRIINQMIDEFVAQNHKTSRCYTSLGSVRYLSALKYMDGVVGNSSSGLIEVPHFGIGAVNIGDRQRGRVKGNTVIDCAPDKESIAKALATLKSKEFQEEIINHENPYGSGGAIEHILKVIKKFPLEGILKKSFYDIPAAG